MGNSSPKPPVIPVHVAIIMDGNGRWAQQRNMPRTYGHKKGVEATRKAISFFARAGVKHLTLFAFSSENWNRPKEEVSTLMSLFLSSLQKNTDELHDNGIRIRFIGERNAFADKLTDQIEAAESKTRDNQQMTLNIAVNYGGQWDIVQAVQKLAARVQRPMTSTMRSSACSRPRHSRIVYVPKRVTGLAGMCTRHLISCAETTRKFFRAWSGRMNQVSTRSKVLAFASKMTCLSLRMVAGR